MILPRDHSDAGTGATSKPPDDPTPSFGPGDLVRHRRYHYRGVVVAFDATCRADDDWYRSNATQPARNQPWYHVLVHGSSTSTYAAQTSLEADDDPAPVDHPLVDVFFTAFEGRRYARNDVAWPS